MSGMVWMSASWDQMNGLASNSGSLARTNFVHGFFFESTTAENSLGLTLVLKVGVITEHAAKRAHVLRYFGLALLFIFSELRSSEIFGWFPFVKPNSFCMKELADASISHFINLLPLGMPITLCTIASVIGIPPLPGNTNSDDSGS